jgi:hypothetical protein
MRCNLEGKADAFDSIHVWECDLFWVFKASRGRGRLIFRDENAVVLI